MASSSVTARPTLCPYRRAAHVSKPACVGPSRLGRALMRSWEAAPGRGRRATMMALGATNVVADAGVDAGWLDNFKILAEDRKASGVQVADAPEPPNIPLFTPAEDVVVESNEKLAVQADNVSGGTMKLDPPPNVPSGDTITPDMDVPIPDVASDSANSVKEAAGGALSNAASAAGGVLDRFKNAFGGGGSMSRLTEGGDDAPDGGNISSFMDGVLSPVEGAVAGLSKAVDSIKVSTDGGDISAAAMNMLPPSFMDTVKRLLDAGHTVSESGMNAAASVGGVVDTLSRGDINSLAEGVKLSALTAITEAMIS